MNNNVPINGVRVLPPLPPKLNATPPAKVNIAFQRQHRGRDILPTLFNYGFEAAKIKFKLRKLEKAQFSLMDTASKTNTLNPNTQNFYPSPTTQSAQPLYVHPQVYQAVQTHYEPPQHEQPIQQHTTQIAPVIDPVQPPVTEEDEFQQVAYTFDKFGLVCVDHTVRLGNCFFDNVAAQLGIGVTGEILRADIVEHLKQNADKYKYLLNYESENELLRGDGNKTYKYTNWEEYLKYMGKDTVWANQIEMSAMSDLLQRPIAIIAENDSGNLVYNEHLDTPPLFLFHYDGNHFVALYPDASKGVTRDSALQLILQLKYGE